MTKERKLFLYYLKDLKERTMSLSFQTTFIITVTFFSQSILDGNSSFNDLTVIFYHPIVLFWQQACLALDVDIISLDLTEKLPFTFKRQQINTVRLI